MGIIKRLGAPSRNLKASVGDIYIDLNNGNEYQCTFAYKSAGTYDCDWKLIKQGNGIKDAIKKVVPDLKETKPEVIEEPKVEEVKEVEKPVQEKPIQQQPKRTDYTSYNKNKNKK